MKKKIVFTVTNNLSYDQRMQKICTSLVTNGYDVLLVGVKKFDPVEPLTDKPFEQKRLPLFFKQGFLSFMESNLRFFLFLLFKKFDAICAIDLDTILPVYFLSVIKRKKRIFDAHELFCETHSIAVKSNRIYNIWKYIEKTFLPQFTFGYTVNESLSEEFYKMYQLKYQPVFNTPFLYENENIKIEKERYILYQGVVNIGRGIKYIIPAMKHIDTRLKICGSGNYMNEAIALTKELKLTDKIEFMGNILPEKLKAITADAYIGLNTLEGKGKSYYLSLSNRTFDYMHACIPQVAMNYPEYKKLNDEIEIAVLVDELNEHSIANAINLLLTDIGLYERLRDNCNIARLKYNWAIEEKKLINFYNNILQ